MKQVRDFLQELVTRSHFLLNEAQRNPTSYTLERDYTAFHESTHHVLGYVGLVEFQGKVGRVDEEPVGLALRIAKTAGLLQSALECFERGFIGKMKHLLHAEMFGDVASQARGLLETGHRTPAAVLGRITIEKWLRDQAEAAGIPDHQTEKMSKLNDSLKAAEKFPQPKWRLIQTLIDVGNAAAHGKDTDFTDEDVKRMLSFIESNCLG